jgi:hypothetical protein
MGRVVRWGRSLTAKETASLKTSRLTWNFISTPWLMNVAWKTHTGTAAARVDPEGYLPPINLFKALTLLTAVETVDNLAETRCQRETTTVKDVEWM